MEIIVIFTIHNQYIYIYTFTIHNQNHHDLYHPHPHFAQDVPAPVQVSQWTTPVARVEWCSPPGRHPEIASRSLRSRSARTSAGRWKTSTGCQPRHNGWGQVFQKKKTTAVDSQNFQKGWCVKGKSWKIQGDKLFEILLFRWVCHEI